MSESVYRISDLLTQTLADVPVGTNLGLLHLQLALLSGRFLAARGAVFPALDALGLDKSAVHRANAALCGGRWSADNLLDRWLQTVAAEGHFKPNAYEGIRPVACDLTAFFRPHLRGLASKHYVSEAGKALPALVFGLCVTVGRVCGKRLGLPRLLLRREAGETEAALQKRLIEAAAETLAPQEALLSDAGFGLGDLLEAESLRFVARVRKNQTARRSALPAYGGRGRKPERGELVRLLARGRSAVAFRDAHLLYRPSAGAGTVRQSDCRDAAGQNERMEGRKAPPSGAGMERSRFAGSKTRRGLVSLGGDFRSALQGAAACGNEFDGFRRSVVAFVSRPVGRRATAPCRQTDAGL